MKQLKLKADPQVLQEIGQFLYQSDNSIIIDEEYKSTSGINMEPIVVAIIIALTPAIQTLIKEYFKYKLARENRELITNIEIMENGKVTKIDAAAIENLE